MTTTTPQTLPFTTLDVFTSTPYTGNPLALIRLPSHLSTTLTQTQKQLIAKEFNLSETVFLHPASPNPSSEHPEYKIDIFTPDEELPFAGHPTIGSASYVLKLGENKSKGEKAVLLTKAGPIPIELNESGSESEEWKVTAKVPFKNHLHTKTLSSTPSREISGLSPNAQIRALEISSPLFSIVKGMTFLLVQLPSLNLLGKVEMTGSSPDFTHILDQEFAPSFVSRYYFVVEDEDEEGKERGDDNFVRIRSRMVESKMEDPATGSAASALGAYLAGKWGRSCKFEIVQGVEMGRRSVIGVEVEVGEGAIEGIRLSGGSVVVMEGTVRI